MSVANLYSALMILLGSLFLFIGCEESDSNITDSGDVHKNETAVLPSVTTIEVTEITYSSAISGGEITDNGGKEIIAKGVCWGEIENPTIEGSKTNDQEGEESFVSNILDLDPFTKYYIRAYATNEVGTAYGNQIEFTTCFQLGEGVVDVEGNEYVTVIIGEQEWMAENLKTTSYNDGTHIPHITDNTEWSNQFNNGAYCWYENNEAIYRDTYGALYNWWVIETGKICPEGWHVPSDDEWNVLIEFLGGDSLAGGKLKDAGFEYWNSPNTEATNITGFKALPGGQRMNGFGEIGEVCMMWSATSWDQFGTNRWKLSYTSGSLMLDMTNKTLGSSIRCIKD